MSDYIRHESDESNRPREYSVAVALYAFPPASNMYASLMLMTSFGLGNNGDARLPVNVEE